MVRFAIAVLNIPIRSGGSTCSEVIAQQSALETSTPANSAEIEQRHYQGKTYQKVQSQYVGKQPPWQD